MRHLWHDVGRDSRWVLISFALWGIGEGLWMFIQPLYLQSLGATPGQAGFVIGLWGMGRLLFVLPVGILADRWGSRRLLLPGWYLGLLGVVIIALAPDWRWTAPGFLIYGMSAIAIPVTNLYLTQAIRHDPTRRPDLPLQTSLSLLWVAYSLGIVVTPGLGGWLGDQINLRVVYLFSVVWFALSTLAILKTVDYPAPERPPHGYDYQGLLRRWPVRIAFSLLVLGLIAVMTGQSFSSQYLEEIFAFSRTSIGVFGSVNALGTAAFSLLLGHMEAWRGFFAALLLVAGSFVLLLLTGSWPVVVLAVFLLGAYYAARPLAVSVISLYAAEHQRGLAYALVDTLAGAATVIGLNLAGTLYGRDPEWPFMVSIVVILVVTVAGGVFLRPQVTHKAHVPLSPGAADLTGK